MINFKDIIFTSIQDIDKDFYPMPAIKNIPDWYKKTNPYINNENTKKSSKDSMATIKKCIPVFDAMTAGYILFTHVDIYVDFDQNGSNFVCPFGLTERVVVFHPNKQAEDYPKSNLMPYPKFLNPWSITTPKGYSTLFISPMHQNNEFLNILPGIVDTDTYTNPVNLPFILNNPTFEGLIPAGTPICQAIPFKREKYSMKIKTDPQSIIQANKNIDKYFVKFFNNYKTRFWQKKSYE